MSHEPMSLGCVLNIRHQATLKNAQPTNPRAELKHGRVCMLETWLIKPPKGHSLGQGLIAVPQQDLIFVYIVVIVPGRSGMA